jgi:hypothetical protein
MLKKQKDKRLFLLNLQSEKELLFFSHSSRERESGVKYSRLKRADLCVVAVTTKNRLN